MVVLQTLVGLAPNIIPQNLHFLLQYLRRKLLPAHMYAIISVDCYELL